MKLTSLTGLTLNEEIAETYRNTLPRGRGGTAWNIESYSTYIHLRFPNVVVPTDQEWFGTQVKHIHICEEHGSYEVRPLHTLTYYKDGKGCKCPKCRNNHHKGTCGVKTYRRATKDDKAKAKELLDKGLSYKVVSKMTGWNNATIRQWFDLDYKARHTERCKEHKQKRHEVIKRGQRNYHKTENGKTAVKKGREKRNQRKLHAEDYILIHNHPDADYQGFVEDAVYDYITPEDYEFWSFDGAEADVEKRKKQQKTLSKISGEPYSLEHLIPLSKGGIHHPMNFVNRALELNLQKNGKLTKEDCELFCNRLFN